MALGGTTVAELKGRMLMPEFIRWVAYDRIEPIGDHRLEGLLGYQTAVLLSASTETDQHPGDHMPYLDAPRSQQSAEEIFDVFKMAVDRGGP